MSNRRAELGELDLGSHSMTLDVAATRRSMEYCPTAKDRFAVNLRNLRQLFRVGLRKRSTYDLTLLVASRSIDCLR